MTAPADLGPHPGWRWFAMLGGMSAYAAHLLVTYYSLPAACAYGTRVPLYLVTVALAGVAGAATIVGWRQRHQPDPQAVSDPRTDRRRFMSRVGVFLSLLATLTIIAAGAATPLFDPCQNWV